MDLFGLKEHDERHAEVERQIRHLLEQVAQLTIDRVEGAEPAALRDAFVGQF